MKANHLNWRKTITSYFTFTRKDRIGILLLLTIIVALLFSPRLISYSTGSSTVFADSSWISALRKLEANDSSQRQLAYSGSGEENPASYQYDRTKNNYPGSIPAQLFPFDPNTLSGEGWKKLGLRDKTIQTIRNYTSKGGRFRKPEDLQHIYGLNKREYERLLPYVNIAPTNTIAKEKSGFLDAGKETTITKYQRYAVTDINIADTTAFIALPGIGSKLAARIVNFRDKLGGFYSVEQVRETFGLPDSTFQKIKQYLQVTTPVIKKININTATVDELKAHPYIRYLIGNPLVLYRKEHGPYSKPEDIKKVAVVTEAVFAKIAPYLTVE